MSARPRRTIMFALVVLAACYTVRMDEAQIRARVATDLACEEDLIHLEVGDSEHPDVARYLAHGCGQTRTYECSTEESGRVVCSHRPSGHDSSGESSDGSEVAAAALVGCACAHALGHHGGGGGGSGGGGGNAMPSDPVRTK